MVVKVIDHEYNGTTTKQLDLRDAEPNDKIEFTLLYDEPLSGSGKWGKWYKFTVNLHQPEAVNPVTFFAPKRASDGRLLGEVLTAANTGARFTLTAKLRKTQKGGFYLVWDVDEAGSESPAAPTTPATEAPAANQLDDYQQQVVAALIKNSGATQQEELWVRTQLKLVGITDEFLVQRLLNAYEERFKGMKKPGD